MDVNVANIEREIVEEIVETPAVSLSSKKSINTSENQKNGSKKSFNKSDIRSYGNNGSKTQSKSDKLYHEQLESKIEALRNSKPTVGTLPNVSDRVTASNLLDKVIGPNPIKIPKKSPKLCSRNPCKKIQKDDITV